MKVVDVFIEDVPESTVFHIGGEDLWGYKIKAFSKFVSEKEILIEPEAKVLVNSLKNLGTLLTIEVTLQPFDHLALEDIIPVGNASPVPTQIGLPSVTKAYLSGSFPEIQGKSAFYGQNEGNFPAVPQMPTISLSDGAFYNQTFNMQKKWDCAWKECPPYVNQMVRYSVDTYNPRVATKIAANDNCYCTIIGNAFVPFNMATSWSIRVLRSRENNGNSIYVGVAPSDINQNGYDYNTMYGWYMHCQNSTLWSGPPHNYRGMTCQQQQMTSFGGYMNVGVLMDTTKGDLSFILNGVNLGVAYGGIPLDKPLVPCVILWKYGDSVELNTSEVKDEVDSFIPVLSNLTVKNVTHDSITLMWDKVGYASFYQIEVDGSKPLGSSSTNTFTKRGFLPETGHFFRVRAVVGSSVSEWSGFVKGRTLKAYNGTWKECPAGVKEWCIYSVDWMNNRIATKVGGNPRGVSTIIGNTHIPLKTAVSWNIRILKPSYNEGKNVFIGVAPFDINQNDYVNNYGWYFHCYNSTLCSGPPHNYDGKEYGPRKADGQYVHTGDAVGVVMDTIKGELSFILGGINCGVAYCGIPLDKPFVPCVLLRYQGVSVGLTI